MEHSPQYNKGLSDEFIDELRQTKVQDVTKIVEKVFNEAFERLFEFKDETPDVDEKTKSLFVAREFIRETLGYFENEEFFKRL